MGKHFFYQVSKNIIKLFKIVLFTISLLPAILSMVQASEIPSDLGTVNERIKGRNSKTLYLIEEAHVDYGAQKAIAGIADSLAKNKKVRLFLVEGGWGDISLSYLRGYGLPETRRAIAEQYLREGKISGEEFLNVTSDIPMALWGIENESLYAENMKAFLTFEKEKPASQNELAALRKILTVLQPQILSAEFSDFLNKRAAFYAQKITLLDYLRAVRSFAGEEFSRYPLLGKVLEIYGHSGADTDKAQHEKQILMGELSRLLTKPEFADLRRFENAKDFRSEYRSLQTLLRAYHNVPELKGRVSIENLKAYKHMLKESLAFDSTKLFGELESLENKLMDQAAEGEEKTFTGILKNFELLEKLFDLQMTVKDMDTVSDLHTAGWHDFLAEMIEKYQPEGVSLPDFEAIDARIPLAKNFYFSAVAREEAMVKNAMERFEDSGESRAVMIVGGFHSQMITKAFQEKNYTIVKISPKFEVTDEMSQHQHYLDILKYKWERSTPALKAQSPAKPASGTAPAVIG